MVNNCKQAHCTESAGNIAKITVYRVTCFRLRTELSAELFVTRSCRCVFWKRDHLLLRSSITINNRRIIRDLEEISGVCICYVLFGIFMSLTRYCRATCWIHVNSAQRYASILHGSCCGDHGLPKYKYLLNEYDGTDFYYLFVECSDWN